MVLFFPNKNVYSTLIGTFDEENLGRYVDDVLEGKVSLNNLDEKNIVFNNINCEELKEEKFPEEEDEILKEIIEEERRKREQFEKEREEIGIRKNKKKKNRKAKDNYDL